MRSLAIFFMVALLAPNMLVAQTTPHEYRVAANQALSTGAFAEAIPLLEQLISWFRESTNPSMQQELERFRYNLGMCYYITGNMASARGAYRDYLEHHRRGPNADKVAVYVGDTHRFEGEFDEAIQNYVQAVGTYQYDDDWMADIESSIAKAYLAEERWAEAMPHLLQVYRLANDWDRRNWAASLLAMSYLQERDIERVFDMMSVLMRPDSFASRSIALNLAALEIGDELFAEERYREALWIYRIVYPHDLLALNNIIFLERQEARSERLRRQPGNIRRIVRIQEEIGQVEQEMEALSGIDNYDNELFYRIARSSMETKRYRESCELFYHLYSENIPDRAEECLYLAFRSASSLVPFDRAIGIGSEYMEVYPGGEYYDGVSLMVGMFYARLQDWPNTIATLKTALEVSPDHGEIVECHFIIGYASFMEEDFEEAVYRMRAIIDNYPLSDRLPDANYWLGMALLFDKDYEEAVLAFEDVIRKYPDSEYVEDASFRSATCDYGMGMYESAEVKFLNFVRDYPDGVLAGEAYVMLGDIAGVFGDLHAAIEHYARAAEYEINIELYNHAMFRSGEMFEEMRAFERMITHFEDYLERGRPGSNAPLAIYWIGNAYWSMDRQQDTLDFYMEAIEQFADDRLSTGVDLVIEEWIGKVKSAAEDLQQAAWRRMRDLFRSALDQDKMTALLRAQHAFLFNDATTEDEKRRIRDFLVRERNLGDASVGVLELILDSAMSDGDEELARQAASEIISVFPETDTALYARIVLAEHAIERGDHTTAIMHLDIIREVYATSPQAAEALLRLGDIYLERGQFDRADQHYTEVLGVREWRDLWPEALYGRGQAAFRNRNYERASAYFERIYILYGFYEDWVARAYIARAECLERMREYAKAAEVLQEMLSLEDLANGAYNEEAARLLERIGRRG